ncbi:MAG TPA: multicopper oxidase domain-containing protein [Anaerolineales bacterium]|nr:multicopper oxidase domain-containing protein [Anaerolineales bacterium]
MITRRDFLKLSGASMAALFAATRSRFLQRALACQSNAISKFAQPLRGVYPLDPNGIPVAVPDGMVNYKKAGTTAQHYTIDINQYQDILHPDLCPTTLRGYHSRSNLGGDVPQRHLGGIIVGKRGTPVQITFQNNLTGDHPLPVDPTVMGTEDGPNRVVTHLHGGLVPWLSDGGPFAWFDSDGNYGPSAQSGDLNIYKTINPHLLPGQAEFYYPLEQSARLLWYHDHAVGITRLNAYAGIATALIIRDNFEGNLRDKGLPDFIENGGREIPIVIQDKIFVGNDISTADPGWSALPVPQGPGSLWYPHVYDAEPGPGFPGPGFDQNLSLVPEMFGDTMLANGVVFPFAPVEPRRYRLRILNACQARFLNLQLYVCDSAGRPDKTQPGPDFLVIGTEGGFLSRPVLVASGVPFNPETLGGSLITAPAERWDIIIDFKDFEGKTLVLYNDAPAPFPGGDSATDFDSQSEVGPDTRTIMRFDVAAGMTAPADPPLRITRKTNMQDFIDPSLVGMWTTAPLPPLPGALVRQLTLNEDFDEYGRLIQLLGTNEPTGAELYGRAYMDEATETPISGKVEVWQIANLTGDSHPIHFHLANVQVLSRQTFAAYANGAPIGLGAPRGPEPTELGWKETVKMHPNEITTVIMRFSLPKVPFTVPLSPRTGGHEYVWHCHILEHEEHDMMRPLIVTP